MKENNPSTQSTSKILASLDKLVRELESQNAQNGGGQLFDTSQALEAKAIAGRIEQLIGLEAGAFAESHTASVTMARSITEHDEDRTKRP